MRFKGLLFADKNIVKRLSVAEEPPSSGNIKKQDINAKKMLTIHIAAMPFSLAIITLTFWHVHFPTNVKLAFRD